MTEQAGRRKIRVGRVIGDRMDKTVVVAVERRTHHTLYRKSVRKRAKFKAHDEENAYRVGDWVRIVETRPLSAAKRWRVDQLLARAEQPEALAPEEVEVQKAAAEEVEAQEAAAEESQS